MNMPVNVCQSDIYTDLISKAAVLTQPRHFSVCEMPVRKPLQNEVLIRLEGCGVCGSNGAVWEGKPWFSYPLAPGAPGHEGWGKIENLGSNVKDFYLGQRVTFLSSNSFAQYETVPVDNVVIIPDKFSNIPFPGEPIGCAVNIFERSLISKNQSVAIIGIGFIGALLTALCSKAGAEVAAFSRRDFALSIASQLGASHCCKIVNASKSIAICNNTSLINEFDCVIEAAGYQESLDIAGKLVKNRGRLIIAGYHQDGPRIVDMQSWNWRGIDVINAHEREMSKYKEGIIKAINSNLFTQFEISKLLTNTFPINNISSAFQMMNDRPDGFMKAIITL